MLWKYLVKLTMVFETKIV